MNKYTQLPPLLLARAIKLCLKGYVRFPKDLNGSRIKEENEDYIIFRKVEVRQTGSAAGVSLKIFFRFKSLPLKINRILSLIPIPFIIAQPGFRSKTWMFGEKSAAFHGLYQWDSPEDAQHYWDSLPLKMMRKRAIPETLVFEIMDQ